MSYLFHTNLFMPNSVKKPVYEGPLRYGPHALREARSDRFGNIELPQCFDASIAQLIEVEFDERKEEVVKQVWRQPLDETRDLVLVVTKNGFVKTVWVNLKSDKHRTLDASRYVRR